MLVLTSYERRKSAQILEKIREQRSETLDRLIQLKGESLEQFVYEYSQWTEAVTFVEADEPDMVWVEDNLYSALEVFSAQTAWVLRPDGQIFYGMDYATFPENKFPPPPPFEEILPLFQRDQEIHFFYEVDNIPYEVRGYPIVTSEGITETSIPRGYLIIGRRWDAPFLERLSSLTDSTVILRYTDHTHGELTGEYDFHLHRSLPDSQGTPLRILDIHYTSSELELIANIDRWEAGILLAYALWVMVVVTFFTLYWVLRPLSRVRTSLLTGDIAPVSYLLNDEAEFGQVARLVRTSFQDKAKLTQALEERQRLGRDLHDGVIQTLYATGMTMTSIRANVRRDPDAAESLIDQTRSELNATIRDVRHFISRLEPEHETTLSFQEAVQSLLEFMQGGQEIDCSTQIDTALAAQLSVDTRAQLLQIVKEAASNAIRHGKCRHLKVILQTEQDKIRLAIVDDGCGFDPDNVPATGLGIHNFHERAHELDATLDISSRPGHGAHIAFILPSINHS